MQNVHPLMQQALAPWAPHNSEVHQIAEEQRIAADLAYDRMKNSGELLRREIDRAHMAEIQVGAHE